MAVTVTRRRPSVAARRGGYLVAAAINVALLYLTHVQPGWRAVPFLTEEASQVLGLFTVSLLVGMASNLLYIAYDQRRLKALGDLVTTGLGLAVLALAWQVFPFDFSRYSLDWAMITRTLLVVATTGSAVGVIVQLRSLIR